MLHFVQFTVYDASSCRKVPELIKANEAHSRGLAVIKRFTGGGTVVVDKNTIFTTLIMSVSPQHRAELRTLRCTRQFFFVFKTAVQRSKPADCADRLLGAK